MTSACTGERVTFLSQGVRCPGRLSKGVRLWALETRAIERISENHLSLLCVDREEKKREVLNFSRQDVGRAQPTRRDWEVQEEGDARWGKTFEGDELERRKEFWQLWG